MYKSTSQLRGGLACGLQHRDGREAMGLNKNDQGSSEQGKKKEEVSGLSLGTLRG